MEECTRQFDFRLVGEGNDHCVVSLLDTGYVLRIKKVASAEKKSCGNLEIIPSYDTLVQQCSRDLAFLNLIATKLFGPLLVEPGKLVRLSIDQLMQVQLQLHNKRDDGRLHKSINPYGIAVMCPDATSEFRERKFEQSSLITPDSVGGQEYFSNCDVSKNKNPRSVPVSTICIELKPKQGFRETAGQLSICRFCLKQFIKCEKGTTQKRSQYCPLELFSGDVNRMVSTLEKLFDSPQNNLKIFKDGEFVTEPSKYSYLCHVIAKVLLASPYSNSDAQENWSLASKNRKTFTFDSSLPVTTSRSIPPCEVDSGNSSDCESDTVSIERENVNIRCLHSKLSSDSLFSSESEGSEVDSSCECSLYECQDYLDEFLDAFEGNNIVRDFPECEYSEQGLAAPQTEPSVNNDEFHTQIDGVSSAEIAGGCLTNSQLQSDLPENSILGMVLGSQRSKLSVMSAYDSYQKLISILGKEKTKKALHIVLDLEFPTKESKGASNIFKESFGTSSDKSTENCDIKLSSICDALQKSAWSDIAPHRKYRARFTDELKRATHFPSKCESYVESHFSSIFSSKCKMTFTNSTQCAQPNLSKETKSLNALAKVIYSDTFSSWQIEECKNVISGNSDEMDKSTVSIRSPKTQTNSAISENKAFKQQDDAKALVSNSKDVSQLVHDLRKFLSGLTFKDCSLMLLLRGPYERLPDSTQTINEPSSPFWVQCSSGYYLTQVTVIDLVSKDPAKVSHHYKAMLQLTTLMQDLLKNNRELLPKCCSHLT